MDSTTCPNPHPQPLVTIELVAQELGLPAAFLLGLPLEDASGQGVNIVYRHAGGKGQLTRRRTLLHEATGPPAAEKNLLPYGQDRLRLAQRAGFMVLMDTEEDCWPLWYHQLPALGLSSAAALAALTLEMLPAPTLCVCVRSGRRGQAFLDAVAQRLAEIGYAGRAVAWRLPESVARLADMHRSDPPWFRMKVLSAVQRAAPVSLPEKGVAHDLTLTPTLTPNPSPNPNPTPALSPSSPSDSPAREANPSAEAGVGAGGRLGVGRGVRARAREGERSRPSARKRRELINRRASFLGDKLVDWLWLLRIAFGKLTMLDGDPEVGKSALALDLAARLTRGLAMPGEERIEDGGSRMESSKRME